MELGVSISTIKLNKKNSKKTKDIPLNSDLSQYMDNCQYSGYNFEDAIKEFYNTNISQVRVEDVQKYFGTKKDSYVKNETDDRIYISFTIACGAYGIKSDMIDTVTGKKEFERNINHADVKDFRVMISYKKNQPDYNVIKGVILFQTLGQYGIKMITVNKIKDFFSKNFNIMPIMNNASTKDALNKIIENGGLKSITLIKNQANPKFSNMYGINCGKEKRTILLSKVREKKDFINKLLDLASSKDEVFEFEGECDDISLTINIAKRQKTIWIKDINSISIIEELPKNVMDGSGNIIIDKIDSEMIKYSDEYLNNLVDGEELNE